MPKYIINHRPDDPADRFHNSWTQEEGEYEHPEEAVRGLLTKTEVIEHEYVVYEVTNAIHSDQFHHDGTFDDIVEELE